MVDVAKVLELRAEIARDRQGYADCCENCVKAAAPFLDAVERNIESLELDALRNDPANAWQLLPQIETRLNREAPSEEHIAATIKTIREVQSTIAENPPAGDVAAECLRILVNHLDVLERKRVVSNRIHDLVSSASSLREEIQECDALLKRNSDLQISAELVFNHVEKSLAPALQNALDAPLQDSATQ